MSNAHASSTCPSTCPTSTRQAYRPKGAPITLYPTSTEAIEREIIDPLAVFIDNYGLGGRKEVPTYFDVEAIAYRLLTTYTTTPAEVGVAYGLEQVLPDDVFWEICDERAR